MLDTYHECTKSMLTCVWALSLFSAEQLTRILSPEALTPRHLTKMTFEIMQQSAAVGSYLMPGYENRLAWQELTNKLQAFDRFVHVDVILRLPSQPEVSLLTLIKQAAALGPYDAVWAMEGLGWYYAETHWEHRGAPQHLLTEGGGHAMPPQSLIPLHTGMGLSLAGRLLATLKSPSSDADIDTVLRQFMALCQQNSRTGYAGAALEALGLITRLCYPQMIHIIDRRLAALAPDIAGYFWHGVGRGLYFLPLNMLPCSSSTWRAIEMAQGEAPHTLGQLNALEGLAWAITLVNIRHPAILETLLHKHGDVLSANEAFSTGVGTALMIWHNTEGWDPYLRAFLRHQPDPSKPRLVQLWNSQVRKPAHDALHRYYAMLQAQHSLGEVFRHQPLSALENRFKEGLVG